MKTVNYDFALKNFKFCEFASYETNCFSASLYANGKKIADCSNDGQGGNDIINFVNKTIETEVNKELSKLNKNIEEVVNELVMNSLIKKENEKIIKKTVKGLVFKNNNGEFYYFPYSAPIVEVLKSKQGVEILKKRIMIETSKGSVLINTNIPANF